MARSLRVSREGIAEAKKAFKLKGWTQEYLAGSVGCTRQVVGNFFARRSVASHFFTEICAELGLEWREITELEPGESEQDKSFDIDALVQEVREKIKASIQGRCGTMRVLDMSQPIGLNDIYTNVNILEKITGRRRKGVAELLQECNSEDFDRFGLGRITEERMPGLDAVEKYSKLMILGKPGAGKTTFLKFVAIQCNKGEFQVDRVPIFITLKNFAEAAKKPSLIKHISQQFSACRVTDAQVTDLFNHSKALVLLDGLDEVREEDNRRVLDEIRDFSDQFRDNHFVMTCRIAAREYTFEKFTEVEVADFDDEQIATFATNWFKNKTVKPATFIKRLKENNRIKELATNPLLLTLLCLVFEGSLNFPANRSELYEEGLEALLKKWDAGRGIERNQVYKKLSLKRKEELLSKIALATFEQGDYFFKQKTAEQYITEYIRNLTNASTDEEELQRDSEDVLRSIEAQHGLLVERAKGIYSFSHLTLHEYFTAREFIFGTQPLEEMLQNLVSHIIEKRWREVFLLAVGMLPSADHLLQLMKQQVDVLIGVDEKLQEFLRWLSQKTFSVEVPYKPAVIRAFYCYTARVYHAGIAISLVGGDSLKLVSDFAIDDSLSNSLALARRRNLTLTPTDELSRILDGYRSSVLDSSIARASDPDLQQLLQKLKEQLLEPDKDEERFSAWWQANSQVWTEQLKAVMIEHRNIGHDWQFSKQQRETLEQYCDANNLLVDCLNSGCYVSREVRQEIEDTLLLPIAEIEQRKG
jgi:predicted NACHT family NTPase